jgi:intracellular septation protein A
MSVPQGGPARVALGWLITLVLNIALPIVTYDVLTNHGVAQVPALLLGGVWPALELAVNLLRTRKIDEFSVMVLIFLFVGVISALAFNSPRLVLIKEGATTGLFGLVFLGSLLAPKPLMFYFGRRFATSGIPARIEWWDNLWQYQGFRRSQRVLTAVWGVALAGSAGICIALTYVFSVSTMVVVMNVTPYVVLGLLIAGTAWYGKYAQRRPGAAPPPIPEAETESESVA